MILIVGASSKSPRLLWYLNTCDLELIASRLWAIFHQYYEVLDSVALGWHERQDLGRYHGVRIPTNEFELRIEFTFSSIGRKSKHQFFQHNFASESVRQVFQTEDKAEVIAPRSASSWSLEYIYSIMTVRRVEVWNIMMVLVAKIWLPLSENTSFHNDQLEDENHVNGRSSKWVTILLESSVALLLATIRAFSP
jgi:hypothetical protein